MSFGGILIGCFLTATMPVLMAYYSTYQTETHAKIYLSGLIAALASIMLLYSNDAATAVAFLTLVGVALSES